MNLIINRAPDVENILANDMRDYFINEIDFQGLFPNDSIKVSTDHPFVDLMNQEVPEGGSYSLSVLPSVTIIDTSFVKLIETPVLPVVMRIMPAFVDEIKKYGRDEFTVSKQVIRELEDAFRVPGTEFLRATGFETWKKTSIAIEIWAANNVMKGKIFDLVHLYLAGQRRFTLHTDRSILIEEETVTGEKSGIYNFDFGETLYGSMLRFTVGYKIGTYKVENFLIGRSVDVADLAINAELFVGGES